MSVERFLEAHPELAPPLPTFAGKGGQRVVGPFHIPITLDHTDASAQALTAATKWFQDHKARSAFNIQSSASGNLQAHLLINEVSVVVTGENFADYDPGAVDFETLLDMFLAIGHGQNEVLYPLGWSVHAWNQPVAGNDAAKTVVQFNEAEPVEIDGTAIIDLWQDTFEVRFDTAPALGADVNAWLKIEGALLPHKDNLDTFIPGCGMEAPSLDARGRALDAPRAAASAASVRARARANRRIRRR